MLVANDEFYESIDNSQQDEYDIVLKASKGDKIALEYIIKKYKNFVKAKAKSYFLALLSPSIAPFVGFWPNANAKK